MFCRVFRTDLHFHFLSPLRRQKYKKRQISSEILVDTPFIFVLHWNSKKLCVDIATFINEFVLICLFMCKYSISTLWNKLCFEISIAHMSLKCYMCSSQLFNVKMSYLSIVNPHRTVTAITCKIENNFQGVFGLANNTLLCSFLLGPYFLIVIQLLLWLSHNFLKVFVEALS